MGDAPINLKKILEQTPKWTFAGDYTLLQWMKQISQDLELRASKTTENLSKLDNSLKSTNIALDNVANSLITLQFGNQFVECRVHDDDETLMQPNKAHRDNQNPPEQTTSKEMLNHFLNNNLKVLRNCYEKYSIDLEDSDDEETTKEKTCIYQPINPYNDKPLPFIFGSKEWHSEWHVGLCENQQESSYSGDEISEVFSNSSTSSHLDDNESFESSTEWVSSNSVNNENPNSSIEIKNASSLPGSQLLYPVTPVPINRATAKTTISESSSLSTTSSLAKKSLQIASESRNSVSSTNSTKGNNTGISINKNNSSHYKMPSEKIVDLFAEPSEDIESTTSSVSAQNIVRTSNDNKTVSQGKPSDLKKQSKPFVDLFAEPLQDVQNAPYSTIPSISSKQNINRKTINLFDDNDNIAKDDLLSDLHSKEELENKTKILFAEKSANIKEYAIGSKISKSLFDDSDDDDDFLKAFIKKSSPKINTKPILFDNEIHMPKTLNLSQTDHNSTNKIQNSDNNAEDNEHNLHVNQTRKEEFKTQMGEVTQLLKTSRPDETKTAKNLVNVVNDFNVSNRDELNSINIPNKNLFDDFDDGDDNLFKTENHVYQQSTAKDEGQKNISKVNEEESIFENFKIEKAKNDVCTGNDNTIQDEKDSKPGEVVMKDHSVDQTMVSDITRSKVDPESIAADKQVLESVPYDNFRESQKDLLTAQEKPLVDSGNGIQKKVPSNTYEFNSILFLDEPPEDDKEFFETLSKTTNSLNSNYNTIDLENDMYEPELPKVPATNINSNQTDAPETLYRDLQLFSDIPPDDDVGGSNASNIPSDVNHIKRLHSVFYDDFNETLLAINQKHTQNETLHHSVYSDEPPPMNEALPATSTDIIDHIVPDEKPDVGHADNKTENSPTDANLKEILNEHHGESPNEFSFKKPPSKLQMPQININVQALLPRANNILSNSKNIETKSDTTNSYNYNEQRNERTLQNEFAFSKVHATEVHRSKGTEHILPNLTKNRVKAPAARRPSTRKSRQENYRQSLIEQQQMLESADKTITNEIRNIPQIKSKNTIAAELNDPITETLKSYKPINVLLDNKHDVLEVKKEKDILGIREESSEGTSAGHNINCEETSINLNKERKSKHMESHENNEVKTKSKRKESFLLFEDDEEDDDFFKHIKTSKSIDANISSKVDEKRVDETSKSLKTNEKNVSSSVDHIASEIKDNKKFLKESYVSTITNEIRENQAVLNFLVKKNEHDDDDSFFEQTLQKPLPSTMDKIRNNKEKKKFKSFLDSESEEEPESRVSGHQIPTSRDATKKIFLKKEMTKTSQSMKKSTNAKLFTTSESDSDDLFKEMLSSKSANKNMLSESTSKNQTKAQASLFGDDSDSDNFLTTSASASKKELLGGVLKKKNLSKTTSQQSSSLFSDLDSDEDDLFGGGAAKVKTNKNVTAISNVESQSPSTSTASATEISKSRTVNDNPLADLL